MDQERKGLIARVASNVRRLRLSQGLSAMELAKRSEMHLRLLQKLESGEGNLTIRALARVSMGLGVDVMELFRPPVLVTPSP